MTTRQIEILKYLPTLITLLISCSAIGQVNSKYRTLTRNAELDKLNNAIEKQVPSDSAEALFNRRKQLKDGDYSIYWDDVSKVLHYKFTLKDGNVHGTFYCWNAYGLLTTVGNYYNDSTWSFRSGYFLLADTTFKCGSWRYHMLSNPRDSAYYYATITDRKYKMPFDSTGLYKQEWFFRNGQLWEEKVYSKEQGLIKKMIYNEDGVPYSSFYKYPNCSITQDWDEMGNLQSIYVADKMSMDIELRKGEQRFYPSYSQDPESKRETLRDSNGKTIQERYFYPNGNLVKFIDEKAGITISYSEDGEVTKVEKEKGVKVSKMKN